MRCVSPSCRGVLQRHMRRRSLALAVKACVMVHETWERHKQYRISVGCPGGDLVCGGVKMTGERGIQMTELKMERVDFDRFRAVTHSAPIFSCYYACLFFCCSHSHVRSLPVPLSVICFVFFSVFYVSPSYIAAPFLHTRHSCSVQRLNRPISFRYDRVYR